jgi:hypothetical protein
MLNFIHRMNGGPPVVERRRVQRVQLPGPTLAALGAQRAFVVNLSTEGAAIVHSTPVTTGRKYALDATVANVAINAECELLRCRLVGKAEDGTPLYQSGLAFKGGDLRNVRSALTALVAAEIERTRRARAATLTHSSSATQL